MPIQHTAPHTYQLDSGLKVWLEPTQYSPALIIKRPHQLKQFSLIEDHDQNPYIKPIRNGEMLFLEDLIRHLLMNPEYEIADLEKTVVQLKKIIEKIESHIERRSFYEE